MITKEYSMAYVEVLEIIRHMPSEDIEKIPKEKIAFYESNMDKEYVYKLDSNKKFKDQIISDTARAILANLYRDYWATINEREKILLKERHEIEGLEQEKRKKYNSENIFNKKNENNAMNIEKNNLPQKVEKSFLQRIIDFFIKNK